MAEFAVLESGEGLARRLEPYFGAPTRPEMTPGLLVVAPGVDRAAWQGTLRCGTVLLPGTAGALLAGIEAAGAVSYGTSGRDSVTLSSRAGQRLVVSLQRELVRLDGAVLERQEIAARVDRRLDNLSALALIAAMLLLGVGPEELSGLYLS